MGQIDTDANPKGDQAAQDLYARTKKVAQAYASASIARPIEIRRDGQPQCEMLVIMIDHLEKRGEAAGMIEEPGRAGSQDERMPCTGHSG